jgi:hypothetical protein
LSGGHVEFLARRIAFAAAFDVHVGDAALALGGAGLSGRSLVFAGGWCGRLLDGARAQRGRKPLRSGRIGLPRELCCNDES